MESRISEENWKLLLASLIKRKIPEVVFGVNITAHEVVISTTEEQLGLALQTALRSPEAARTSITYSISEQMGHEAPLAAETLVEPVYPMPLILKQGIGMAVFERLFGATLLKRLGQIKWTAETGQADSHILYAHCEEELLDFTELQIKKYKDILSHASFLELRQALTEDDKQYSPLKGKSNAPGILAQNIEKILYFKTDLNQQKSIYFDFGLLAKCLTPPDIKAHPGKDEKENHFEIRINKNHLMSYLSILFKEGFILHITENGDQKGEARPICFNMQRALPVNNVLSLILDTSFSMKTGFDEYIKHVKQFVAKVADEKDFSEAHIRISVFNDKYERCQDFSPHQIVDIPAFLDTLEANGNTYLNGTLCEELSYIKRQVDENAIVVLFTDGEDNKTSAEKSRELEEVTAGFKRSCNPPKIYSLGLGSSYNKEKLTELAVITGGEHIKLNKIEDFDAILAHLDKMGKVRRLTRFIQEMKAFSVPAYEGEVTISPNTISVPGAFSVDETDYYVVLNKPELIAEEKVEELAVCEIGNNAAAVLPVVAPVTEELPVMVLNKPELVAGEKVAGLAGCEIGNEAAVALPDVATVAEELPVIVEASSASVANSFMPRLLGHLGMWGLGRDSGQEKKNEQQGNRQGCVIC